MARYFMTCVALASMFFISVDVEAVQADSVERQEALDYILELPLSRQEKFRTADGGQVEILLALFVFERGIAQITRVSKIGHLDVAFLPVDRNASGSRPRYSTRRGAVPQETLNQYQAIIENLPAETPGAPIDQLLLIRFPSSAGTQTKQFDRAKLPTPLRKIEALATGDAFEDKSRNEVIFPKRRNPSGRGSEKQCHGGIFELR